MIRLKCLDLFAGIGGIRLGMEATGAFETVWANDIDPKCKATYDLNFDTPQLTVADITKMSAGDIPDCDFLTAGFPCQAFSISGKREGFEDIKGRGTLFFDVARIIEVKMPKGFLLENVKHLLHHDNGNTFQVMKGILERLGYYIRYKVLDSAKYGNIPQHRERIYIVGFRDEGIAQRFVFPKPIGLSRSITDLLDIDVDIKYYYNGKPQYPKMINDIVRRDRVYQWRGYGRENKSGLFPTLTANMGTGGNRVPIIRDDKGIRKITPRECFRVQGFPDDFQLPADISDSALYKQIGNSVTVPVVKRIADSVVRAFGM